VRGGGHQSPGARLHPQRRRRKGVRLRHGHLAVPELPRAEGCDRLRERKISAVLGRLERVIKPTITQVEGFATAPAAASSRRAT
jgi:hypothetical protein